MKTAVLPITLCKKLKVEFSQYVKRVTDSLKSGLEDNKRFKTNRENNDTPTTTERK
ncbi:hypothetical protein [Hyunsoonleella ulvae]|uniref:hypothetical protein n=1 Tax=Hyunsoonleella ulvae TaxID=2799948 RepID=UPI001939D453|nr:hypothetical protein [Hyunsoonleella ulvae]